MKKLLIALVVVLVLLGAGAGALYYVHSSNLSELKKLETTENGWAQIITKIDACNYPVCTWLLADYRKQAVEQKTIAEEAARKKAIAEQLDQLKKLENEQNGWQKIVDETKKCPSPCPAEITEYGKVAEEQVSLAKKYQEAYQAFNDYRKTSNDTLDEVYKQYGEYDFSYRGGKNCDLVKKQETLVEKLLAEDKNYEEYLATSFGQMETDQKLMKGKNQEMMTKIVAAWRSYEQAAKALDQGSDDYEKQFLELLKKECAGNDIEQDSKKWEEEKNAKEDELSATQEAALKEAKKLTEEFNKMNAY